MKAYAVACDYVSGYVDKNHLPLSQIRIHDAVYRTNQKRHPERFGKKKRHATIRLSFRAPQLSLVWNRDYSLVWNADIRYAILRQ